MANPAYRLQADVKACLLRRGLIPVASQGQLSRQPAPRTSERYIEALRKYQPVDESYFYAQLRHFVLFRTMQVLGAYGFRGYFEKKPHFIQSVPFAIENLRQLLQEPYPEYPYLCKVLHRLTELKQFHRRPEKRRLVVKVTSFAYKKGIPEDSSGNGGGFVFDCRAVNNPGKYERYKLSPVSTNPLSASLKRMGKSPYSSNTYMLVDASVKRIWNGDLPTCPYVSAVQAANTAPYIRPNTLPNTSTRSSAYK